MKTISRRNALLAGFSSLITFGITSAYAAPASVPVIWDGKKMFESFEKEGTGISSKGPAGRPKAYVAFDTQCRDCWQLHRDQAPYHAENRATDRGEAQHRCVLPYFVYEYSF